MPSCCSIADKTHSFGPPAHNAMYSRERSYLCSSQYVLPALHLPTCYAAWGEDPCDKCSTSVDVCLSESVIGEGRINNNIGALKLSNNSIPRLCFSGAA